MPNLKGLCKNEQVEARMFRSMLILMTSFLMACGTKSNPCQGMIDAVCSACEERACELVTEAYEDAADDPDKAEYCRNYTDEEVNKCAGDADSDADSDADADADMNWDGTDPYCTNTCDFAGDDVCDDGGTGSAFHACAYGTDCADCGPRAVCSDTCSTADDGDCDDGFEPNLERPVFNEQGPEATFSHCESGTDCGDCGSRY